MYHVPIVRVIWRWCTTLNYRSEANYEWVLGGAKKETSPELF